MKRVYMLIIEFKTGGHSYITFERLEDANNYSNLMVDKQYTGTIEMRVISYVESEAQNESTTTNA